MASMSDRYPFINYFRTTGGLPVSIIRAEVPLADRKLFPELAFAVIPYTGPNGFPDIGMRGKLAKIEDEFGRQFEQFQGIGVGHALGRNNLIFGFYCRVTPPSSMKVRLGLFANEKIELTVRHDPDWQWYDEHLGLEPSELEHVRNQGLLKTLLERGDNPQVERAIDIGVLFPTAEAREKFLIQTETAGFPLSP